MALERNPAAARAMVEAGFEVASHGWRWIDYQNMPEARGTRHICSARSRRSNGLPAAGRSAGTPAATAPTRAAWWSRQGGFLYDSDFYADDLPYWIKVDGQPHLVIPYTLDNNDMKFAHRPTASAMAKSSSSICAMRSTSSIEEGGHAPKMMSVGLHCRLAGRPGPHRGADCAFSTMRAATTTSGSPPAPKSPATGASISPSRPIDRAAARPQFQEWPAVEGTRRATLPCGAIRLTIRSTSAVSPSSAK